MKKTILIIFILLLQARVAWTQAFNQEEISYDQIEKTYICYEADNFKFLQHQPEDELSRNYRHIPLLADRFFITMSSPANVEPIRLSYPADQRPTYYSYRYSTEAHGRLYVAVQLKSQLVPACNGRDEKPNTVITIRNIPANATLFITYKQIESIEIPGFEPNEAQQVPAGRLQPIGGNPVVLEEPRGGGLNVPNVPVIILNPPQSPDVSSTTAEAENPVAEFGDEVMEPKAPELAPSVKKPAAATFNDDSAPLLNSDQKTVNDSQVTALSDSTSGCSLQKNGSGNSNMLSVFFASLALPLLARFKNRQI